MIAHTVRKFTIASILTFVSIEAQWAFSFTILTSITKFTLTVATLMIAAYRIIPLTSTQIQTIKTIKSSFALFFTLFTVVPRNITIALARNIIAFFVMQTATFQNTILTVHSEGTFFLTAISHETRCTYTGTCDRITRRTIGTDTFVVAILSKIALFA